MARVASIIALVPVFLAVSCGGARLETVPRFDRSDGEAEMRRAAHSPPDAAVAPAPVNEFATFRGDHAREDAARLGLAHAVAEIGARLVAEKRVPGAVVEIGTHGGAVLEVAFGQRATDPAPEAMTVDTIFDVASLTKAVATAPSVMLLAQRGDVDLDQPIAKYLPEFATAGRSKITARHLLTHTSGLIADDPMSDYRGGPALAVPRILASRVVAQPGERFIYSDVGYLVLGELVARLTSTDFASYVQTSLFDRLSMSDTTFRPASSLTPRIAPTERVAGKVLRGEVHDPRARALGGVAGHAGVFSTAKDLGVLARALMGGESSRSSPLMPNTVHALLSLHDVPGGVRALGWDVATAYSKTKPKGSSPRAFGHTGYTGTSLWIDPELDVYVVVLTNRVHPDGKGQSQEIAAELGARAVDFARASRGTDTIAESPTRPGIDTLDEESFRELRGARVGLLTNDAARTRSGERTIDRLARAPGVSLVRLFSPEHGLTADREGKIPDGVDAATKLPITSLFGGDHEPSRAALADLDALVVDLVDVGARFYTYASSLHGALRAGARAGVRVVVLDRPNPLGGARTSGPMLSKAMRLTFVNHAALPIEHGMTLGELARFFAATDHLAVPLTIVPVRGWRHGTTWEETGLAWSAPSPNLRTIDQVRLYPGVALVEGANVSVGRGTDSPFELVGAPWIDGGKLASTLAAEGLPGVRFEATKFVPSQAPYAAVNCQGVRITLVDSSLFAPLPVGFALVRALATLYPATFKADRTLGMIGDAHVLALLQRGAASTDVEASYAKDLASFSTKRAKYILYP